MDTLKEASRGSSGTVRSHRLLNSFVVTQLALSVVLLVGAGLLVRSFARLARVHPGFDASQLLTMEAELSHTPYTSGARCLQFYQAVLEAVRTLPTVESAEAINILPMNGRGAGMSFDLEGAEPLPPGRYRMAEYGIVSPGCFQTMRIPLRQGRHLTPADDGQHEVAMVNEAFVRRYLPGVNPLGRRIRQHTGQTNWVEIVGVVADVKDAGLAHKTTAAIYQPFTQTCRSQMSLVIRTQGEPTHLARAVQEQIWRIDAAQPVTNVKPMQEWVRQSVSVERFSAGLLLGFALIGLVLAGVGLFGVLAYAVSQRTHEFGVRLAMGAQIGEILRLVLIQGLKVAGLGLGLGLAGALALSVVLQSLLFEMRAQDPLTFLVVVLFLGLVALAACYLPARRATQVEPMVALRCE
jgi:putative ABC transport system permease protein